MATISASSVVSPPGTRLPPRQNIDTTERILSATAGAALTLIAAQQRGTVGVALGILGGALVARSATGAAPVRRVFGPGPDEAKAVKQTGWKAAAVVSRAVTINAPRQQVYDYFRDFAKLPSFMVNIDKVVETDPTHSHWSVTGPGGSKIEWDAVLTEDKPGQSLAWESLPRASIPNKGTVEFRDATGGRGTEVHATIIYQPPGGTLGRLAAKLTQKEPGIQVRRDLKRLKMLLETGEISTNAPQGTMPKA